MTHKHVFMFTMAFETRSEIVSRKNIVENLNIYFSGGRFCLETPKYWNIHFGKTPKSRV